MILSATLVIDDEDLDRRGVTEFLKELAAVAARCGRYGEIQEAGTAMYGEIGDEELLSMNRMVQREAGKFEVDAEKHTAVRAESDGADVEVGDRRAGEGASGGD